MEHNRTDPARWLLLASVLGTVLLYVIPYGRWVAYPLLLLSTFAHEMGHGVAGWLVGANFDSFVLNADASGTAVIHGTIGPVDSAVISAGGLVGPAVVAALLFVLSASPRLVRPGMWLSGLLMLASCVLVVRNIFGLVFVGLVGLGCLLAGWKGSARLCQAVGAFLGVQMALSVFSRGDYLFTEVAETAGGPQPSDVAQMAEALVLPYWFWGAVCGLLSVAVLALGLWMFWRATRK